MTSVFFSDSSDLGFRVNLGYFHIRKNSWIYENILFATFFKEFSWIGNSIYKVSWRRRQRNICIDRSLGTKSAMIYIMCLSNFRDSLNSVIVNKSTRFLLIKRICNFNFYILIKYMSFCRISWSVLVYQNVFVFAFVYKLLKSIKLRTHKKTITNFILFPTLRFLK
jgi:hypothetical protein